MVEAFNRRFIERTQHIRVSDPFNETSEIGPMISAMTRERMLEAIAQAQQQGANRRTGYDVSQFKKNGFVVLRSFLSTSLISHTVTVKIVGIPVDSGDLFLSPLYFE
ncbi:aldehyde dehydrogenase family protein [Pectobacteriaceae bacterium CE90]|nr:aldehyde dehydrogenase family protein [Pectobacteriaceae bacterium CE90]